MRTMRLRRKWRGSCVMWQSIHATRRLWNPFDATYHCFTVFANVSGFPACSSREHWPVYKVSCARAHFCIFFGLSSQISVSQPFWNIENSFSEYSNNLQIFFSIYKVRKIDLIFLFRRMIFSIFFQLRIFFRNIQIIYNLFHKR